MVRTDTGLSKVDGVDENYLAKYEEDHSLDAMDEYRILPRHKMIQSTTLQALKDNFGEGSIILQPGNVLIWKRGDNPFQFVPLLFFVEWLKWADRRDANFVLGRTMNPTDEIAKKAKDPKRRFEVYDGHEERDEADQWQYRYVQTFRYVGIIYDTNHPLNETLLTLSFERGEFSTGQNLINAVKMQKVTIKVMSPDEEGNPVVKQISVPLFGQIWSVKASLRERPNKKWWGLDVQVLETRVPSSDIEEMESLHKEYKKAKDAERLVVEEGPSETDDAAVAGSEVF